MPNVRIRFQGICLFCAQNNVMRVYLPDASGDGHHGPHHPATTHVAKLFVQESGDGTDVGHYHVEPLNGHEIAFHDASGPIGGGVQNLVPLRRLPSLADFAPKVVVHPGVKQNGAQDTRVVAAATVAAGTLQTVTTPKRGPWKVRKLEKGPPAYHRPNSLGYWMNVTLRGVTKVVITDRTGHATSFPVGGDNIIIANRPSADSNADHLKEKPDWLTNSSPCDHHFPWHYTLLKSESDETLDKRLLDLGEVPRPCFGNPARVTHPGRTHHDGYGPLSDDYPTCFCMNC